jgi:NhaP-type Na+/H+ or K+/H+ antiporter
VTEAQPPDAPFGNPTDPAAPNQWTPPPYQSVAPVEQPSTIRLAVRGMWVGAAISFIGIVVAFAQRDELRDQFREADSSLSSSDLDTAVAAGLTFIGVIGVVAMGLWLWMATTNGQGRAWARTVATVLGGLNIVFTALGFFGDQLTPLNVFFSILGIALAATILVLLYRPESTAYYDYRSRSHMAG